MISIHSSHTGRDRLRKDCSRFRIFQSTLPIREETENYGALWNEEPISIHSSHTGRDAEAMNTTLVDDFNPLFPYGKRPCQNTGGDGQQRFQSTLPIREETHSCGWYKRFVLDFNPLSPHGERPIHRLLRKQERKFQSTLPTRGETSGQGS